MDMFGDLGFECGILSAAHDRTVGSITCGGTIAVVTRYGFFQPNTSQGPPLMVWKGLHPLPVSRLVLRIPVDL
jgi:hypothetical protein